MAGQIKVDSINADSNLALKIANTAVAFIDSSGLRPISGNVNLDATATSKLYLPSANTVAIQTAGVTAVTVDSSQNVTLAGTLTTTGITNSGVTTATRFNPTGSSVTGNGMYLPAANSLGLSTNGTNAVYIDSSQNVGIGTASPSGKLDVAYGDYQVAGAIRIGADLGTGGARTNNTRKFGAITSVHYDNAEANLVGFVLDSQSNSVSYLHIGGGSSSFNSPSSTSFYTSAAGITDGTERMRIDSSGNLLVGKTASDVTVAGTQIESTGTVGIVRNGATCLIINRLTDDGTLVSLRQASTEEGTISVSGTTVSYNGGHLSRWAQTTAPKDDTLVKGTVLSNLDEMNVYTDADGNPIDNEQLNKVKVSDVEGDANVAGVFVNWTHDDAHNVDEINMAMTGDMIIRIAQGTTVARGDLLMSAGDGTAKPQGDDIVRSKTVAKVTSTHVTCTYADGSYCVPCVLMAC